MVFQGFVKPVKDGGRKPNNGNTNIQSQLNADVTIPFGFYLGSGNVLKPMISAGNNVLYSDNLSGTPRSTASGTYTKVKDVDINLTGQCRVTFNLASDGVYTVYGKIYKNGVSVGTERSTNSATYVEYTEDFSVNAGDNVQLYILTTYPASPVKNQKFEIQLNEQIISVVL